MSHTERGLPGSMPSLLLAAVLLVTGAGTGCTQTDSGSMTEEREVALADTFRSLAEEIDAAWKNLEPEPYLQHYSDDVQFYYQGSRLGRSAFETVVRQEMPAIEAWSTEITDERVEVLGPNAGVVSLRYEGEWTDTAGETRDIEAAVTLVFERRDGEWTVVQAHESFPPDVELP